VHALDLGSADRVEYGSDLVRDEKILSAMHTHVEIAALSKPPSHGHFVAGH
jgi:hypothetical protein